MKKNTLRTRYTLARVVILTSVLLLTTLTILSPTVAAKPPKPAVKFTIMAAYHEGGWVAGTIYDDATASGSGSICNLDFRVEPGNPPLESPGLVWQVTVTAAIWDAGTGTLTVWVELYSPKLGLLLAGGPPEEISGLSEGHNVMNIFGSKHIIQIQVMP